jgi:hypothetical protein
MKIASKVVKHWPKQFKFQAPRRVAVYDFLGSFGHTVSVKDALQTGGPVIVTAGGN